MRAMTSDSSPEAGGRITRWERPAGREVLHGREAEQKIVRDLLRRAQRGAGGLVLVDGEPGIGKSLLLRDATDEAAELGFSLAAGAADQLGQTIPFFALRAALHEPSAELSTDDPGRGLPTAAAWWMTQIRANLEQRASAAPVLVCLDDLHWASPATLAALRALPRDLKHYPVAWLLARSSTPQRATGYLFGQLEQDGAARVTLGPLDQDAVAAARDLLARPLPPTAEDRLRCAMSSVLCARGQASDARAEAERVLARPRLPGGLRDQALTAHLQALAGLRDDLASQVADTILAAPARHDSRAAAAALLARAAISWNSGQIGDGLELLRDAAQHGTGISADARQAQPLLALAAALVDLRQPDEAEDILRAADNPALENIPAEAARSLLRARLHLAAGRPAEAAADAQAALAVARALGAHGYAATAHSVLSVIELRRGDITAAAQHLASRPATGPQFADLYARPETTAAEAQVTEARDGPAAALGLLRQLCADLETRPGLLLGDPAMAAWLARTALAAGDTELAASAASTAEDLAGAHPGLPALAAAAAHSRGLAGRDPACLAKAAAQHPDPWARASAAEDLGVLHGRQGDRDQAIRHLNDALGGYRQVGAGRDQARARRRLRQLGIRRRHWSTPPARPVTGWHSLTDTEQAVAGLVAQGLNNNQVAARMYISTHTVAHHLRQAFRKLSIASRYELTRIAIEQAADSPTRLATLTMWAARDTTILGHAAGASGA